MAIAEHDPEKLNPENRGMLKMSHQQLHDFADTKEKGLPQRVRKHKSRTPGQNLIRNPRRKP